MSEMVEKVARALCKRVGSDPDKLEPSMVLTRTYDGGVMGTFDGPLKPVWTIYEAPARAAIEAMREPTEAMSAWPEFRRNWREMIDAALKD